MAYQDFTVRNLNLVGDEYGYSTIFAPSGGMLEVSAPYIHVNNFNGVIEIDGGVAIYGDILSDLELPNNSITTQDIDVIGDLSVTGATNLTSSVYEQASGNFDTVLVGNTNNGFTIPANQFGIILGTPSTSFSNWEFINVDTSFGKVVTVTLILNASTAWFYADTCSINGVAVSGGVLWPQGVKPVASSGDDLLTFVIVTDNAGVTKVYGSSILNYI